MPIVPLCADADLLSQAQRFLTQEHAAPVIQQHLEAAWQAFYEIYTRKIRAYAFTCGAEEDEIADCVQDVWAELLVRLRTFRLDPNRGKFDTWLFCIVRGKTADLRRCRKHRHWQGSSDDLQTVSDNRRRPSESLAENETATLAWDHLRKNLSSCSLQVLQLRLLDQRPVAEVAETLGISPEQVWYRFHRARKELERIGSAWLQGRLVLPPLGEASDEEKKNPQESAQGKSLDSVSPNVGSSLHESHKGNCVDYVFQRLELGRRELIPEWKVEWNCDATPKAVLYIRKTAIVAYAEICAPEDIINTHWPRIVNAAIAAGVAAGIATIIATPTAALPIFKAEFYKQFQGKGNGAVEDGISVALSAKVEANGPWCGCRD